MNTPEIHYDKRKERYIRLQQKQTKAVNLVSNLRLAEFTLGLAGSVFLFWRKFFYLGAAYTLIWIAVFIYLVIIHQRMISRRKYAVLLSDVNDESLKRLKGEWINFADSGSEFKADSHSFSSDLDIFGRGSLFQWICTAKTFTGRLNLKQMLTEPLKNGEDIALRQEAVKELASKLGFRQKLQAEGMVLQASMPELRNVYDWENETEPVLKKRWANICIKALPAATILLLLLALSPLHVPFYIPAAGLLLQIVLIRLGMGKRKMIFDMAEKHNKSLRIYLGMLRHFDILKPESRYLIELKKRLVNDDGVKAHHQVERLTRIMDMISNRYNLFYFFFNVLTLWDYQCWTALERWKERSGRHLPMWFDTVGEVEALSSLALIRYDNPEWAFPEIDETSRNLCFKGIGHPLLGKGRVCNDLVIKSPARVMLVTGSNMSGKSTFLRAAGINLVLAYAGAPVLAESFRCPCLEIYTCMRISDNLEKSISSFYAELVRIKMIVKAVEEGRKVFFLLDEIFKGTNSADRHTGARVLIDMLSRKGAVGLVSTHDLELGEMEKTSGNRIINVHFSEYYKDNKIHFDYKLKPGVSSTRNAIYLMRLAGIEVEEK